MVFQNYALWPHMTVTGNVAFGPRTRGVPARQRRQLVREMLDTVRIADKASSRPMELSGGQQQRVALARALAARPKCLLMDEPLSNLDASLRAAMRWEIQRIVKSSGTTTVYVTHDQAEALAIADRIAVMREGRIVQVGTGRALYERPTSWFVAEFLGDANFLPASHIEREGAELAFQTPIGPIHSRCSMDPPAGGEGVCCIRPECLRPGPPDRTGENTFCARLVEWSHLGGSARFRVRMPDGTVLSGAAMPARPVAEVGEQISVTIAPEDVIVLPA